MYYLEDYKDFPLLHYFDFIHFWFPAYFLALVFGVL